MLGNNRGQRQKKVSALDIRRGYTPEKARLDLMAKLWFYLVLRPISFHVAALFVNLGFSANAVTALGLIPLLGGLVFILLGAASPFNFVIGALFVNLWYLFDAIDGNVARFRSQTSNFGAILDHMVGKVYHTFLPLCLGLGLYFATPEWWVLAWGLELPLWCWLLFGVVESLASLLRDAVSARARIEMGEQAAVPLDSKPSISTILPRAILSFNKPLLLIASLVGALGLFLFSYAVYNLAALVGMVVLVLRKALLADQQRNKSDVGASQ